MSHAQKTIDVHCHLHHFGDEKHGYVHPQFINGVRARYFMRSMGLITVKEMLGMKKTDKVRLSYKYAQQLKDTAENSSLDHVVILALDGVYSGGISFDKEQTTFYVSNDLVFEFIGNSKKMKCGASINPSRPDWEDELDKSAEQGAVLIKWLPCTMGFDPSNPQYIPFYEKLLHYKLPLLSHVGFEYALNNINPRFSDLDRLQLPLQMGVTIIAAHCCGGRPFVDSEKMFQEMKKYMERYPTLYTDVSAMAVVTRKHRFKKCLANPIIKKRLIYGSDYPVPYQSWAFTAELKDAKLDIRDVHNFFDRDILIKKACGLSHEHLAAGTALMRMPPGQHELCSPKEIVQ
ncbi:MAG: amidohydrolase family protein [Parcubacteria group bacterium]|nr:amidohydrolase family protein [Parcubacteria group bacterium]